MIDGIEYQERRRQQPWAAWKDGAIVAFCATEEEAKRCQRRGYCIEVDGIAKKARTAREARKLSVKKVKSGRA